MVPGREGHNPARTAAREQSVTLTDDAAEGMIDQLWVQNMTTGEYGPSPYAMEWTLNPLELRSVVRWCGKKYKDGSGGEIMGTGYLPVAQNAHGYYEIGVWDDRFMRTMSLKNVAK